MEIPEIYNHIIDIYGKQEKLDEELKIRIEELQSQCSHLIVVETNWQPSRSGFFSPIPPARICIICSLEENGWGSGYKKLNRSIVFKIVSRDEFYRHRKLQPAGLKLFELVRGLFELIHQKDEL